ncbi:uncharacterized protein BJ171DRAFT_505045 [Polychytrium aggregatum]|uniref:uncharacterized protein n=1 Tax=Polychytrium aggregatum TaxID=110093 RepID=UPI0022FEE86D|nr:uncharacterized protein BJ171DRAFT_505045 [Polychytrium aggregatum]KAI9204661.1 hypothetical protein BJ171DRAFT_505045 [Polychytrium aggregatum]
MPSGLPPTMRLSYRKYKQETAQLVHWIEATSAAHSPRSKPSQPRDRSSSTATNSRRNGKMKNEPPPRPEAPAPSSHSITLAAFSQMIESISGRLDEGILAIPDNIYAIFHSIIQSRLQFVEFYSRIAERLSAQGKLAEVAEINQSTQSHMHFLSVLQVSFSKLGGDSWTLRNSPMLPNSPGIGRNQHESNGSVSAECHFENRFSALQVDESVVPAADPLEEPAPSPKVSSEWSPERVSEWHPSQLEEDDGDPEYEDIEDDDQASRISRDGKCFDGRSSKERKGSQPDASLDGRTMPGADDSSDIDLDGYGLAGDMHEWMFAAWCLWIDVHQIRLYIHSVWEHHSQGKVNLVTASLVTTVAVAVISQLEDELRQQFPHFTGYQDFVDVFAAAQEQDEAGLVEEVIMLPTFTILKSFSAVVQEGTLPVAKAGVFGPFNPRTRRSRMTSAQRRAEDKSVLCTQLADWAILARATTEFFGDDAVVGLVRPFIQSKEIPLRLVFSAQAYLTSLYTNRRQAHQCMMALYSFVRCCQSELEWQLAHGDTYMDSSSINKDIKAILESLRRGLAVDLVFEHKRKHIAELGGIPIRSHEIFERNPWLCGACMYKVMFSVHHIGIQIINQAGFFVAISHIYNALRRRGYLSLDWPLLDSLMELHSRRIFNGKVPTTDFLKSFALSLGVRIESFARDPVRRRKDGSAKGPRRTLEFHRHGRGIQDESLLHTVFEEKDGLAPATMDRIMEWARLADAPQPRAPGRRSTSMNKTERTPVDLLKGVANLSYHEQHVSHAVGLNLLGIHRIFIETMQTLRDRLSEHLPGLADLKPQQWPFIAGHLLSRLDEAAQQGDAHDGTMQAAARVFAERIERTQAADYCLVPGVVL